jgi:hypothetical protein
MQTPIHSAGWLPAHGHGALVIIYCHHLFADALLTDYTNADSQRAGWFAVQARCGL